MPHTVPRSCVHHPSRRSSFKQTFFTFEEPAEARPRSCLPRDHFGRPRASNAQRRAKVSMSFSRSPALGRVSRRERASFCAAREQRQLNVHAAYCAIRSALLSSGRPRCTRQCVRHTLRLDRSQRAVLSRFRARLSNPPPNLSPHPKVNLGLCICIPSEDKAVVFAQGEDRSGESRGHMRFELPDRAVARNSELCPASCCGGFHSRYSNHADYLAQRTSLEALKVRAVMANTLTNVQAILTSYSQAHCFARGHIGSQLNILQ
jgi:hypothetical protein